MAGYRCLIDYVASDDEAQKIQAAHGRFCQCGRPASHHVYYADREVCGFVCREHAQQAKADGAAVNELGNNLENPRYTHVMSGEHSWVAVPVEHVIAVGCLGEISEYSYVDQQGETLYLEYIEDWRIYNEQWEAKLNQQSRWEDMLLERNVRNVRETFNLEPLTQSAMARILSMYIEKL
jgi:hypothetical protein